MTSARKGLLALGLAASLAGCATVRDQMADHPLAALTPTEQWGVQVTSHPEQIALGPHAAGLSANQQAALAQFVAQWRDDGGGDVVVRAPSDGPGLGQRMAGQTLGFLRQIGVPADRLRVEAYASGGASGAPVLASYQKFAAVTPNCSGGWDNVLDTGSNGPFRHFGCAVTANAARQTANPRDLLAPAAMAPADGSRREVVLGKYRNGEVTSTAQDTQASGKVSSGIQ